MEQQAEIVERTLTNLALSHVYMDLSRDESARYATESPQAVHRTADTINCCPDRFLFGTDVVAPASVDSVLNVYDLWAPAFEFLAPEAKSRHLEDNFVRLFDLARSQVRAREPAQLQTRSNP